MIAELNDSAALYKSKRQEVNDKYADIIALGLIRREQIESSMMYFKRHISFIESKKSFVSKLFFYIIRFDSIRTEVMKEYLNLPISIYRVVEKKTGIGRISDIKKIDDLLYVCKNIDSILSRLMDYWECISVIENEVEVKSSSLNNRINNIKQTLKLKKIEQSEIEKVYDQICETINNAKSEIISIGRKLLDLVVQSYLVSNESASAIFRYKSYLPDNIPWKQPEVSEYIKNAENFLKVFRLNAVTSLSVKKAYPLKKELFDIVIIDEASQCDIASALPLIFRAKQLVVIGDPMQLKHISSVNTNEENMIKEVLSIGANTLVQYAKKSLWDYCNELIKMSNNNDWSVLDCHYRCHPQIIGFSNEYFYRRLGIHLNIQTNEKHPEIEHKGIIWKDTIGMQKSKTININDAEVNKSIEIADDLVKRYPTISIGIITPFRDQAQAINNQLSNKYGARVIADTVTKFQGDERDVIIYSLVVTDNSPESKIRWIDCVQPNLVNVAVTRARTALYIVGNKGYIRKKSSISKPLGRLLDYVERSSIIQSDLQTHTYIIDTNVFISCPDIIDRIPPKEYIVISAKVIDELDKLKVTLKGYNKHNAETALRIINKYLDGRKLRIEYSDLAYLPIDFDRKSPDNQILSVVLKYRNQSPILLSSDNGLLIKAKGLGIKTKTLNAFLYEN